MSYTKNHDPWTASDLMTTIVMDNFETIYSEASTYLAGHNHDALYQTKGEMVAAYWHAGNDGPGSGADADMLYKASGNLHAADFSGLGVATGLVVLWYGSVASIPSGWHLCDGDAGTIDLRGKFLVGAGTGASQSVGATGGSSTFTASGSVMVSGHSLTVAEMPSHRHTFTEIYSYNPSNNTLTNAKLGTPLGEAESAVSGDTSSVGSGDAHSHSASFSGNAVTCLPFGMALCYIQKI